MRRRKKWLSWVGIGEFASGLRWETIPAGQLVCVGCGLLIRGYRPGPELQGVAGHRSGARATGARVREPRLAWSGAQRAGCSSGMALFGAITTTTTVKGKSAAPMAWRPPLTAAAVVIE